MPEKAVHIGVILSTEMGCFRSILRGINAFTIAQAHWKLELFNPSEDFVSHIRRSRPDALLLGPVHDPAEATDAIAAVEGRAVGVAGQFNVPVWPDLLCVESDDEQVGELAAAHFLTRGFSHFAFLGTPAGWSDRRFTGFERALRREKIEPAKLIHGTEPSPAGRGWPLPHYGHEILDWLATLPRPLAVFACNDLRGRELAELCRSGHVRVPDDVAVLGVDNDDLECELSHPPLSSVAVAWRRLGYEAARLLERVLRGQRPRRLIHLVPPETVVVRQSTDTTAITDVDVSTAVRFIRENAHRPIGVPDVLNVVPSARRSLEKQFRAILGRSPLEEIRRAHVERAKHLLTQTDLPMPQVAQRSGFASAAWFSKAFRDLAGETPTHYRQRFRVR